MRPDRLTTTAQQALSDAHADATTRTNPEVGGLHLLAALLSDRAGPAWAIVGRVGAEPARVVQLVDAELSRLPKTSSGAGTPGRLISEILAKADAEAKRLGDEYVSSEHLLLALAAGPGAARDVLSAVGVTHKRVEEAVKAIRAASGVTNVTD